LGVLFSYSPLGVGGSLLLLPFTGCVIIKIK